MPQFAARQKQNNNIYRRRGRPGSVSRKPKASKPGAAHKRAPPPA